MHSVVFQYTDYSQVQQHNSNTLYNNYVFITFEATRELCTTVYKSRQQFRLSHLLVENQSLQSVSQSASQSVMLRLQPFMLPMALVLMFAGLSLSQPGDTSGCGCSGESKNYSYKKK